MLDFVIVTHLPCFYKVNLYNQLSKKFKIHVIFLGRSSFIRTDDFLSHRFDFKTTFLSDGDFETRSKWQSCRRLLTSGKKLDFKKLIVGGWEHPEFWLALYTSSKSKNCLCLESGFESSVKGAKAWVKKQFLKRITCVLAAGAPQKSLVKHLSFEQTILTTRGVGLFEHPKSRQSGRHFQGRFLYVGRLAPEKNIHRLIEAFRQRPQFRLTLAGSGPIEIEPASNMDVLGHVPKEHLHTLYQSHDVFILPSLQEPWGLVVEEALFHGLPVLVSDRVGAKELVETYQVGRVFSPDRLTSMLEAIDKIAQEDTYQNCCARMTDDLIQLTQAQQVLAYEQALS